MQTLRDYRKAQEPSLSLEALAEKLGLSRKSASWLSEIETGARDASPMLALRIERLTSGAVTAGSVCKKLAAMDAEAAA